jgi:ArsR family transcriptional regulator, arsenate/arsenite/antimonite-responsive transcriptional repressor
MEERMALTLETVIPKPGARCCGDGDQQQLSPETAQQFTDDLLILAHPVRIQILAMLAHSPGQVCVCDLEAALPVKQPTVSHHLKLLRDAGLIDCERHGLFAYYFVNRTALAELRSRILEPLDQLA